MPPPLAVAAPAVLLVVVAATQMWLASTAGLSPWKGGGFGMFASVDGTPFRQIRVFVAAPQRSEELHVPPSLEVAAARAVTFPHPRTLEAFAQRVAARERRLGRDVETVRLEIWRAEFSTTLDARQRVVREITVPVSARAAGAR